MLIYIKNVWLIYWEFCEFFSIDLKLNFSRKHLCVERLWSILQTYFYGNCLKRTFFWWWVLSPPTFWLTGSLHLFFSPLFEPLILYNRRSVCFFTENLIINSELAHTYILRNSKRIPHCVWWRLHGEEIQKNYISISHFYYQDRLYMESNCSRVPFLKIWLFALISTQLTLAKRVFHHNCPQGPGKTLKRCWLTFSTCIIFWTLWFAIDIGIYMFLWMSKKKSERNQTFISFIRWKVKAHHRFFIWIALSDLLQ